MLMNLLASLVLALQAEESILGARLVKTDHPRLFFINALWIFFEFVRLGILLTCLLLLHFTQYN